MIDVYSYEFLSLRVSQVAVTDHFPSVAKITSESE